ncbi:hypothetical protein M5D96_001690, partial [Drosophila gunungcola]
LICCPIQKTGAQSANSNINQYDLWGLRFLQSVKNCGNKITTRLSGGQKARPGEFPWMALLKYEKYPNGMLLCGGSLIRLQCVWESII